MAQIEHRHRVVIIGGGFGGLNAARALAGSSVDVTLIDRRNFHLFQPLLYQVATGGLSPGDIAVSLRELFSGMKNVRVLLAEVVGIDIDSRRVRLHHAAEIEYDSLIVAAGSGHHYFGNDHWEPLAPGLKSIEDALEIRRRILIAFEAAEIERDPERRRAWLTFVVIGAGPTGVELAGTLGEIANHTLKKDFREIDPTEARIILLEAQDKVLSTFPDPLPEKAVSFLNRLGVAVQLNAMVTDIADGRVSVKQDDADRTIAARTVLWTAGVQASSMGKWLVQDNTGLLDRPGRVKVAADLALPGHPEVFVIGDLANYPYQTGEPLPGLAPVAMQQGRYVAKLIKRRLRGKSLRPFRYVDKGTLATIGRDAAVGVIWKLRLSGFVAWITWLFVHLMYLVGFENRLLVLIQWAWNYVTWNRGARLITGRTLPLQPERRPPPDAQQQTMSATHEDSRPD